MEQIKDISDTQKGNDKHPRIIVTPIYVGDKPMEEVFTNVCKFRSNGVSISLPPV